MRIHFVLVGEGTSDEGLIPHLENLCIFLGADEVTGTAVDYRRLEQPVGHSVGAKLSAAIQLEPGANLFFVHRDADAPDSDPRRTEIRDAVESISLTKAWVAIVPVQETEAWLLLDEKGIRQVAGRPRGRTALTLPTPRTVEAVARPKEKLQEALAAASEHRGRRLEKFRRAFSDHRRILLQRLPVESYMSSVPAWVKLRDDLAAVFGELAA